MPRNVSMVLLSKPVGDDTRDSRAPDWIYKSSWSGKVCDCRNVSPDRGTTKLHKSFLLGALLLLKDYFSGFADEFNADVTVTLTANVSAAMTWRYEQFHGSYRTIWALIFFSPLGRSWLFLVCTIEM